MTPDLAPDAAVPAEGESLIRAVYTILFIPLLLAAGNVPFCAAQEGLDPARERRIDSLLSLLSVEEKAGQLVQYTLAENPETFERVVTERQKELIRKGLVGSLLNAYGSELTGKIQEIAVRESRHGIPLLFGYDVLHGYRTIFPIPLGEAATWDPDLIRRASRVAAAEASAAGLHWTFAPMVDVARDPRWGRIAEGAGEDPFLGSAMAAARVQGFQGGDTPGAPGTLLACPKHFAAYGAAEAGRDYNTVDISERSLREVYLPPFEAAVRAGAGSIMCSFNEIAGVPSSGNRFLLTDILRGEWGFAGFVVSDWGSIGEMVQHGFAASPGDAARLAIEAGVDMDMESGAYASSLAAAVRAGTVPGRVLDAAVRRVLRAKMCLGLFGDPFHGAHPEVERRLLLSTEHRALAREVAARSIVLLKNGGGPGERGILPLNSAAKAIAVIGPLAASTRDPLGPWSARGESQDVVSVLEGIRSGAGPGATITHVAGCRVDSNDVSGIPAAVAAARAADVVILVLGEAAWMSGEAASRASLDLPGAQIALARAVIATGRPVAAVLMNGRPLTIEWLDASAAAILEVWFPGVEAGNAVADVLFGRVNPSGRLPVTFPRSLGQVPLYYAHKNTGRPIVESEKYSSKYLDGPNTPLYPFGYGQSYTTFHYSSLHIAPARITKGGSVRVSVDVTNSGVRAGREVVQLYVRDDVASFTRPVRELRGFEHLQLEPGEKATVRFDLDAASMSLLDERWKRIVEAGTFAVYVGTNSRDCLSGTFEVTGR